MKENIKRMPTDRGRTDGDAVSKEAKAAVPPSDAEGAPDRNEACPPVSKVASVGEETGGRDTAACEETDHAQDKEQRKRELREKAKKVFRFLTNPRLLLCIAIAWMITNGWSYVLLGLGHHLHIHWMVAVAGTYIAFLWLPVSPEKIITFTIAIGLLRLFFPGDQKTLAVLKKLYGSAKDLLRKKKEHRAKKQQDESHP